MSLPVHVVPSLAEVVEGAVVTVEGDEAHHAVAVRRLRVGESVVLTDGLGTSAQGEVSSTGRRVFEVTISAVSSSPAPSPSVVVVQALPKSDRSELAVELATEAGVDAIVPWQSKRCVARWDAKADKGVARWQAVAVAAAKQSRRAYVPRVDALHRTADVLDRVRDTTARGGVVAVLHESATRPFAELPVREVDDVILVVGPEGGLDDTEVDALIEAGAVAVSLGPTVLRTSTAAAVALGAIGVLTGRWNDQPLH